MYLVCVHDAKIAKENGITLQFCAYYIAISFTNGSGTVCLTIYNTRLNESSRKKIRIAETFDQVCPNIYWLNPAHNKIKSLDPI